MYPEVFKKHKIFSYLSLNWLTFIGSGTIRQRALLKNRISLKRKEHKNCYLENEISTHINSTSFVNQQLLRIFFMLAVVSWCTCHMVGFYYQDLLSFKDFQWSRTEMTASKHLMIPNYLWKFLSIILFTNRLFEIDYFQTISLLVNE